MGICYCWVNHDKRERLMPDDVPGVDSDRLGSVTSGPALEAFAWTLLYRWNGDRIEVINDSEHLDRWQDIVNGGFGEVVEPYKRVFVNERGHPEDRIR